MFLFGIIFLGDGMNVINIPFFNEIDENTIKNLVDKKAMYLKRYDQNKTVYVQNDICKSMDIVMDGSLVAYSLSANGSENVVFEFKMNSVIGANLLFGDTNTYPMNIYCIEGCELLHISKDAISELLHNYNFMMYFIKSLSINSQGMNRKILMYTRKSLKENLMDYFEALSAEQKSDIIILPISKKQMADYFGVQRPSLFRELKNMKDERIIDIDNKKVILNFKKLDI